MFEESKWSRFTKDLLQEAYSNFDELMPKLNRQCFEGGEKDDAKMDKQKAKEALQLPNGLNLVSGPSRGIKNIVDGKIHSLNNSDEISLSIRDLDPSHEVTPQIEKESVANSRRSRSADDRNNLCSNCKGKI